MNNPLRNLSARLSKAFSVKRFESNYTRADTIGRCRHTSVLLIDRFAHELPYAHFDDSDGLCAVCAPDGSFEGIGYVIEIHPQTGANDMMAKSLEEMFGSVLEEGTGVQVSLFGSPYIEPLTEYIRRAAVEPSAEDSPLRYEQKSIMLSMAHARADFLNQGAHQAPHKDLKIRARNMRCWMSVVIPTKRPFDETERERAKTIRASHMSALSQWHFSPWIWNKRALINTVSQILNPQRMRSGEWSPTEPDPAREPRMQCVSRDTRIDVTEDGVRFHSKHIEDDVLGISFSPVGYPEHITLASMMHAAGCVKGSSAAFSSPFLITTYLSKGSYDKGKAAARLKSARAEQMAATEIARMIPSLQDEARDWRGAMAAYESGEGLLQLSHEVFVFAKASERSNAIESAKSVFKTLGIDLCVDDYMHLQGLITSLPLSGGPLLAFDVKLAQRSSTKTVANAANTLPVLADWKGTGPRAGKTEPTPILSFLSRRGQLVLVDPYANPNGNYNGVVIGNSGSGKSVLLNSLAIGSLACGSRVYIIDIGGSYAKLCSVLNGQFIELSPQAKEDGTYDCLNPFSMITNIDEDMDLMLPLLAQMASPSQPLDDLRLSHLQVHFRSVYARSLEEGRTATITDLAESLLRNGRLGGTNPRVGDHEWARVYDSLSADEQKRYDDPRLVDLGVQLLPYAKGGPFASFFEGEANINFDNSFIVLELQQLSTRKSLQSVVLLLLMYKIDLEMRRGERSQPKLVIIDEAWDLMAGGHSGKFIETGYRRARKQNGAFFTATQKPGDYWKSDTAKAALDNADCIFILRLKDSALAEAEKDNQLGMDESEYKILGSLTSLAGAYSEVYVRIGDAPPSVNRLILDPYTLLLTSSHPNDISDIQKFRSKGLSTHEAIHAVLKERSLKAANSNL